MPYILIMGLFTFLLLWGAVDEVARHNVTVEEQARRAQLTRAERKAEDAKRDADFATRMYLFIGVSLGLAVFLICLGMRG